MVIVLSNSLPNNHDTIDFFFLFVTLDHLKINDYICYVIGINNFQTKGRDEGWIRHKGKERVKSFVHHDIQPPHILRRST